ncbi:MAG TPA: c-type cytochrome [Gammaproteobacteria bacterium]|nr:c-type cytochrome [Gammaproteobacteria bacterium]HVC27955.1 c-type cytochrome [Gammaproteobacteria bacterium]
MHARIIILVIIIATAGIAPLHAANTPVSSQKVPAKAQVCAGCHGPQGLGGGIYPRIAGQPTDYLQQQLRLFHSGARVNDFMQPVAKGLSDKDITELADYFSSIKASYEPSTRPISVAELAHGRELVTVGDWRDGAPACMRCHGPDLTGVAPGIPALVGQSPEYMLSRLQMFRDVNGGSLPLMVMSHASKGMSDADLQAVTGYIAHMKLGEHLEMVRPPQDATYQFVPQSPDNFEPPPDSAIPTGPEGDMIWHGLQIFEDTQHEAGRYVGDNLNCSSCHMDLGRRADSAPMWAAYVVYPKYRDKNKKVNTLEERIQGCFRYSMNGTPPAADNPEMVALVTYFHWLATGLPVGITPKGAGYPKLAPPTHPADIQRGAKVFADNCALCHGDDGQGHESRSEMVFPPVWGPKSFNWGAGMERISTAAGFIQANMPYGAGGTLSDQDAWDVAAFVVSHARPQDPRFNGSVEETRKQYHAQDSYYGRVIDDHLLGSPANHQ